MAHAPFAAETLHHEQRNECTISNGHDAPRPAVNAHHPPRRIQEAVILGSLCGIGMAILQIPYAPMVGALVGVTALIPYVGAFLATIVGAFMILTVNPFKALVFVIFLLSLQQVLSARLQPLLALWCRPLL